MRRFWKYSPWVSPLWWVLSWPVAVLFVLAQTLVRATSTVTEKGPGAGYKGPAIYLNWHRYIPFLARHLGARRTWMMVSSAPYMQPIARWCLWSGLRLARGASGEQGQAALEELSRALGRGESVNVAVDGPAGPPGKPKRGCVDLARRAGVPLIPVAYSSARGRPVASRWDHSLVPALFDRIEVVYGEPFTVAPDVADPLGEVERRLNALAPAQ